MNTTLPSSRFLHWLSFITLYLLFAFGGWTLLVWLAYLGDWSFQQLQLGAWALIPLLLALIPLAHKAARLTEQSLSSETPPPFSAALPWPWLILSAGLLLGSLLLTVGRDSGSFNLQWLLLAASCLLLVIPAWRNGSEKPSPIRPSSDFWPYLASAGLLVAAYLFSSNTDADDTHFIAAALSLLKYPDAVLFSHDTLFGEPALFNHIYLLNRGQSWEALIALLTHSTGINQLQWYYGVLPVVALLLVPVPLVLLLKRYYPQQAWLGVLYALAFLLAWSTYNHHAGHFFVPRMFQGKSIFVALWVPAIFLAARVLALKPGWVTGLMLALLLIGGGGLTSSALYIGIAAAGTGWLAGMLTHPANWLRSIWVLALVCLPNLLMLVDVYLSMQAAPHASAAGSQLTPPPLQTKNASLFGQFGGGKTLAAIMLLVWLGFAFNLLVRANRARREIALLLGLIVLLLFNRPLSEFLATLTGIDNVNWRLHWAMPLSVILALVLASALQLAREWQQSSPLAWLPGTLAKPLVLATPVLALLGLLAINASYLANKYSSQPHWLKLYPIQREALTALQTMNLEGKVILADERVAQLLPRIDHPAKLISAGDLYWRKPYFSSEETWQRYRLAALIDDVPLTENEPDSDPSQQLAEGVASFAINLVISDPHKDNAEQIRQTLIRLGFHCQPMGYWQRCERP